MKKLVPWWICKSVIMLASSIGLITGIAGSLDNRQPSSVAAAGWQHLSIPVEYADIPGWLDGWECLRPAEEAASVDLHPVPREGTAVELSATEEKQEFRIQLFGIVSEESGRMYCLFDKLHRRWIQISSGQADPLAQVRLIHQADRELVQDMATGDLYLIDSDLYQLVPVRHSPETDSQ